MISGNISRTEKITYQGKVRNEKKTNYFILLFITNMKKKKNQKWPYDTGRISLRDTQTIIKFLEDYVKEHDEIPDITYLAMLNVYWLLRAIESMFTDDKDSEITIRGYRN